MSFHSKALAIAFLLIVIPIKAFAIAGPIEFIALGLPFFRPFHFLLIGFTLIHYMSKRLKITLTLVLVLGSLTILCQEDNWKKVVSGPLRLEELNYIFDNVSNDKILPVSSSRLTLKPEDKIVVYSPVKKRHIDYESGKKLTKESFSANILVLEGNASRSFGMAADLQRLNPPGNTYYSIYDIHDPNIKITYSPLHDSKEVEFFPYYKPLSLPLSLLFSGLLLIATTLFFRILIVMASIQEGSIQSWKTFTYRLLHLVSIGGLFFLALDYNFMPANSEKIDLTNIYVTFMILKDGIFIWDSLLTYSATILSVFLIVLYPNDQRLQKVLQQIRGKKLPSLSSPKLFKAFSLGFLALFATAYFRLQHDEALFFALSLLSVVITDFILWTFASRISADKVKVSKLVARTLGISLKKGVGQEFSTFVPNSFGVVNKAGVKISIINNPTLDPLVYQSLIFTYWTRSFAQFRYEGRQLFLIEVEESFEGSSPREVFHRDLVFNLHPKWLKDPKFEFEHYSDFVLNPTQVTTDLFQMRFAEEGADFLAMVLASGSCKYLFNLNPVLKLGNRLTYIVAKEEVITQSFPLEAWLKRIHLRNFLQKYFCELHLKVSVPPLTHQSEDLGIKELKIILKDLIKSISGKDQLPYAAFTLALNQVASNGSKEEILELAKKFEIQTLNSYELMERQNFSRSIRSSALDEIRKLYQLQIQCRLDNLNGILSRIDEFFDFNNLLWFLHLSEILSLSESNIEELRKTAQRRKREWELVKQSEEDVAGFFSKNSKVKSKPTQVFTYPGYITYGKAIKKIKNCIETKGPIIFMPEELSPKELQSITHINALVLSKGNLFSHMAIVCRELSIPFLISSNLNIDTNQEVYLSPHGDLLPLVDCRFIKTYTSYFSLPTSLKTPKASNVVDLTKVLINASLPFGGVLSREALETLMNRPEKLEEIVDDILNYFPKGTKKIIVRSSAITEDTDSQYAGFFESPICNCERSELIKVFQKVLLNESYQGDLLVQEYIEFEKSGVIFSSEATIAIEVSVKSSGVTESSGADQRILVRNEEIKVEGNCLTDYEISKALRTSRDIEIFFNCPQDIEFGFCNNKLFVLQSRYLSKTQQEFLSSLTFN